MPSWYYEKEDLRKTPSVLDGINLETEQRYRREGARFIINVGTKMGLRYDTMATGVVYFHRFYMFHSFKTFPRYVTACCCLFLAGKVEETPKKCKDIIKTARSLLTEQQFLQFGEDPKEEVMTLERILLQTIKFDLQVDHPYGHLLKYAKSLKGDKQKLQKMVQMAWTFINDSLCTTLCLQWEPEITAIALMYLAGKLSKFEICDWSGRTSKHQRWWDVFVEGMTVDLLEDICHQVLDLYSTPVSTTPQDSPPATPPPKSAKRSHPSTPSPQASLTPPRQSKSKEPPVGQPIPKIEKIEAKDVSTTTVATPTPTTSVAAAVKTSTSHVSLTKIEPIVSIVTTGISGNVPSQQPEPSSGTETVGPRSTNQYPSSGSSTETIPYSQQQTYQSVPPTRTPYPNSTSHLAPYNPLPPPTHQYYHPPEPQPHPPSQHFPHPTLPSNQAPYKISHPPPPTHPAVQTQPLLQTHNPPPQYTDQYSNHPQHATSAQYSVPPLPVVPPQYPPPPSNPHQALLPHPPPPASGAAPPPPAPPANFGAYPPPIVTNLQQPPPPPQATSTGIPQVRITGRF
ncbi:uncharacterized protein LOC143222928 [Tachypleus tridentatus]|uniref:uncharacterized protein LOC143222928 n=1 Tax=Tachypleus tridentatus TaxID=6853 RepID=UPI003FD00BF9